ncbi:N-formylglutamate amidohydrolase [Oceaniradius stylonematis]|uniref:N-formylglutamate amidohydrolase n=1 Tax=Oceaniradius stylonematis TaxID=2184161 RepID=UPI00273DC5F9|nr:N-formylglutamate amidohydrolase [Oceaniradius stylonematis]
MVAVLQAGEPEPFLIYNEEASSPFLLTGDHAGNSVPRSLNALGLPPEEFNRHIGVDIGVERLGRMLADLLDAPFLFQPYSRLVIDCNRPLHQVDAIPVVSDGTHVPGNAHLDPEDRAARIRDIFEVYHARFAEALDRRDRAGQRTILVALHSFTPHHGDFPAPRPWHVGVLWNRDGRLARPLIKHLGAEPGLIVGDNEPYRVSDELDYAIPVHGEARGIVSVELEVRQDLLTHEAGCAQWANRLAKVLTGALADLDTMHPQDRAHKTGT